jgi:hypothetical protein
MWALTQTEAEDEESADPTYIKSTIAALKRQKKDAK